MTHWTEEGLRISNWAYYNAHKNDFKEGKVKKNVFLKYNDDNSMVHHDSTDETDEEFEARQQREIEKADRKYHEMKDDGKI